MLCLGQRNSKTLILDSLIGYEAICPAYHCGCVGKGAGCIGSTRDEGPCSKI